MSSRVRPAPLVAATLLLIALALVAAPAPASIVVPMADDDLIVGADVIVLGRVSRIESHRDAVTDEIETYVTVEIEDVLKGLLSGNEVTLRERGGIVGDRMAWMFANPEFEVGERALLFMDQRADGTLRTYQYYMGKFTIVTDPATGDLAAVRGVPRNVTVLAPRGPGAMRIPLGDVGRRADDFAQRIREKALEPRPLTLRARPALPFTSATPPPSGMIQNNQEFRFLGDPNPPGGVDPTRTLLRWNEPDDNTPVTMRIYSTGEPLAPSLGFDQVRAAFRAWSRVPTSAFRFAEGAPLTTPGLGGFLFNGVNSISFRDPREEIQDPIGCSGILAVAGISQATSAGGKSVNGRNFFRALEGDLIVNDGWDACAVFYQNFDNFTEVMTHELGHVLGLGHSEAATLDGASGLTGATMQAFAHFDGRAATLHADDKAGVAFIYPGRTLFVVKNGPGTGTVTSGAVNGSGVLVGGGIDCGSDCSAGFAPNTSVLLTATPSPGSFFAGFTEPACASGTVLIPAGAGTTVTCTASFTTDPDVVISAVSGPTTATPGSTIIVNNTARNNGLDAGPFNVGIYLSNTSTITTLNRLLATRRVSAGLAFNQTSAQGTSVQIPADVAPGTYFLGAIADIDDEVDEGTSGAEDNNTRAAASSILIAKPDLTVTALTAPATAGTGLTISATSTVSNPAAANITAPESTLAFYLSADAVLDGGDRRLAETRAIPSLARNATSSGPTTLTIPADVVAGSYFLIAKADDLTAVDESNEDNNTRATATQLTVRRPDLAVTSVTAPAVGAPGGSISVTHVVRNLATAPANAPGSTSRLVLSSDNAFGSDIDLGSVVVSPLAAGAQATLVQSVQIPGNTSAGVYWVFARADALDAILEADSPLEANNVKGTASTIIVGADLTVTAATAAPTATAPGQSVNVTNTARNQGGQAAGAFDVGIYLSANAVLDGGDLLLTTRRVTAGLTPAATSMAVSPVTIPANTSAGTYFLLVRADSGGEVTEANESNNVLATAQIQVARADLVVTSVTATPAAVAAGANVSVTHIVKNTAPASGGAGASTSRLYLSADAILDGGDTPLLDVPVGALGGGAQATLIRSVQIPGGTPIGRYFIIAQANATGSVPEANGGNNDRPTLTTISVGPDLGPTVATATPLATAPGLTVNVSNAVKNHGGQAAGAFTVGIYLSNNAQYNDGVDILLGSRAVAGLAAGATSGPVTTPVVIPANMSPSTYFLIVRADSAEVVSEANEANNAMSTAAIQVVRPDLTVLSVTAPAAAAPGANVSVTHVVKNLALAPGGAPATVSRLFLSADATLDGGDVQLGGDVPVGALAGGAQAAVMRSVAIPGGTAPGLYRVIAQTNATGTVVEANAGNNVEETATPIVIGPDVLLTSATTAAVVAPGANASIVYTLKNRGGQPASGFAVGFALVPQPSGADVPLGATRTAVTLAAGAMATFTNPVGIPANTTAGSYRVRVIADPVGVVTEADEGNNAILSGLINVVRPNLTVPSVTFAPAMIQPGANISVTHVVKNVSVAPGNAGPSVSRLLLSLNQSAAGQVADFGTVNVGPIAAGGMVTVVKTGTVQIPGGTPPGLYHLLARADDGGTVLEPSDGDNLGASLTRLVVGPDVTVTTASTVAGAIPGANVSVAYTLKNLGSATGPFNVGFALAPVTPGADVPIGPTRTAVVLAANGMLATTSKVGIPAGITPGQYRVRVIADPADALVEAVEVNNGATTGILTVTPPELSVTSLNVPAVGIAGRSVGIPNGVKNTAAAPGTAPAFQVGLYVGTSPTLDPLTDTLLASRTVATLAPGMTSAATTPVTMPTTTGSYYVGAVADRANSLVEANEGNNQMAGAIDIVPEMVRNRAATAQVTLSSCTIPANNSMSSPSGTLTISSQTGITWSGTARVISGPQINTITMTGATVDTAGNISGNFTIVNSAGPRGGGSFSGSVVPTPGGAFSATFSGAFTVGETCSISGSLSAP
jgi:subtilase family serine protease